MEVEGEGKRKPGEFSEPEVYRQPEGTQTAAQLAQTSSDKRQKTEEAAAGGDQDDDAASTLLPIKPFTAEAAQRLKRLGSPELEVEDEGETLEAMLAPRPPPPEPSSLQGQAATAGDGDWLAGLLSDLNLEGGLASTSTGSEVMDAEPEEAPAAAALRPGSPQAAATMVVSQQVEGGQGLEGGAATDPLISHLAEADAETPIQMLPLDALDRNPLLSQFQRQRVQAARQEQMARAVAAATAFRGGLTGREAMEEEEDEDEVPFMP